MARFSKKIETPSEKVPTEHFLLCNTIILQPSKMYCTVLRNIVQLKKLYCTWESSDTDNGRRTMDNDTL